MGRAYKSAQGQAIDMDRVKLQNEKTIAVGNMKVNARGDQLGPGGEISRTKTQVAAESYNLNPLTRDRRANEVAKAQRAAGLAVSQGQTNNPTIPSVDPSGVPFDEPEQAQDQPAQPQMRGSLADSIARQVTVEQKHMDPNMLKPPEAKGPQRI